MNIVNNSLFFSIIIPTYNSEQIVQKCLKSVLCQSFNNFEILIMDGVSTDNTLEIVKSFNDSRIKIFSEKDKGIYDAMNKGIDKSKGEWLYFLGSDDELYDNQVLKKIYEYIQGTRKKIIYGNVAIKGDCSWARDGGVYDGYFDLEKILSKNICHQAIFYHKSAFTKMGNYNENYKICADYDFNLKCFSNYEFSYADMIIANFQGGNTSSSKDEEFRQEKWTNIIKYYKWKLYKREFTPYLYDISLSKNKNVIIKTLIFLKIMNIKFYSIVNRIIKKVFCK